MFQKCQVDDGLLELFQWRAFPATYVQGLINSELFVEKGFILHLKDTNLDSTNIVSVVL